MFYCTCDRSFSDEALTARSEPREPCLHPITLIRQTSELSDSLNKQKQQSVAVGHFISVHQVSSDAIMMRRDMCGHCRMAAAAAPLLLLTLLCNVCRKFDN